MTGQGELFAVAHVHRWAVVKGPYEVAAPIAVKSPPSPWKPLDEWAQWCYGCSSWIKFCEGVESPR